MVHVRPKVLTLIFRNRLYAIICLISFIARLLLVMLIQDYEPDSYIRFHIGQQIAKNPYAIYSNGAFLPFYQYLIALLVVLGGDLYSVRLMSAFAGSLLVLIVYKTSFLVHKSERTAILSMILASFNPLLLLYSAFAMSEAVYSFLLLLAFYLLLKHQFILASFPLVLSVLTRYESWVLMPTMLLFFMWKEKTFSAKKYIPLLASCNAIVWWLLINKLNYNDPFFFMHYLGRMDLPQNFDVTAIWGIPEIFRSAFGAILYPVIYPFMYAPVLSAQVYKKLRSLNRTNLQTSFLVTMLVSYTASLTVTKILHINWGWGRHFLPLIPLHIILGTFCFSHIKKTKILLCITLSNIIISAFLTYLQVSTEYAFLDSFILR